MTTRVYAYGACEPTENLAIVEDQLLKAHRYRNALIEVERERRARTDRALVELDPEIGEVEALIATHDATCDRLEDVLGGFKRSDRGPEATAAREAVRQARTRRSLCYEERKVLRTAAFASPEWESLGAPIQAWAKSENLRLRAECGVYWGTYLTVEDSLEDVRKGAPPEFRRWTGEGRVAVQLQGGLSTDEVLARLDDDALGSTLLRLDARPGGVWIQGARRPKKLGDALVRIRVGTVEGKRAPVWATVPIVLHRPLPPRASIKWAWLQRKRVGAHWQWSFQFVLDLAEDSLPARVRGVRGRAVGIDVGWRVMNEGEDPGRLRVACWAGSDGREGELALPSWWLREQRKVEDIRSIRDRNFDAALTALSAWISARADDLPDSILEALAPRQREGSSETSEGGTVVRQRPSIAHWKSPGRLGRFVRLWRDARFAGDEEAFAAAEAWRSRDLHLLAYEAHLRDQLQRNRLDTYRKFAATIAHDYAEVRIEKLVLRDFHELPDPAEDDEERTARKGRGEKNPAKLHARDACLSSLRQALKHVAAVIELPARRTTIDCSACGSREDWDAKVELSHTCGGCGASWDQDFNAARNLLRGRERRGGSA